MRYEWTEAMLSSQYHEAGRIETSLEVKGWSETQKRGTLIAPRVDLVVRALQAQTVKGTTVCILHSERGKPRSHEGGWQSLCEGCRPFLVLQQGLAIFYSALQKGRYHSEQ